MLRRAQVRFYHEPMSMSFNLNAGQRGLRLLVSAHDRWTAGVQAVTGATITAANRENRLLPLYGAAVEVLVWARSLDDMLNLGPVMDSLQAQYRAARLGQIDLIEGARYACNQAVHQLVELGTPEQGFGFPLTMPLAFDRFIQFKWATEGHLIPVGQERDQTQIRLRIKYLSHLSRQPMNATLTDLRNWFQRWL
jgi:hypothetical protein